MKQKMEHLSARPLRKISSSQALAMGVRKMSVDLASKNMGVMNENTPSVRSEDIPMGSINEAFAMDETGNQLSNHRIRTGLSVEEAQDDLKSRKISVGYDVMESVPKVTNYDLFDQTHARHTLDEMIEGKANEQTPTSKSTGGMKRGNLGWIRGVLIWSILNLWGVMLFLRIAWMNAQAGMGLFLVIVLVSSAIAILTSLSTSAISTNGEIGTGGTYYMISRSLGPEFGTAIGIIFTLANTVNVSLNLQGFAETIVDLLGEKGLYMVDKANDMRIVGVIALVALTLFTFCGMELASKLQMVFFAILLAAIVNIVIGSIVPPNLEEQAYGFVGYSGSLFVTNFYPAFQKGESFMTVFGVFFPSVTGILAGTSITGDLRDPSGAIPKGTIIAILFTSCSYILVGWVTVAVTLRHASGSVEDLLLGNLTACEAGLTCARGNINDYNIMQTVAHFRWIVVAGVIAATLSTSLGCIVFAPKIFQAVCRDKILPGISIFGHGYGKNDEPYRAYGLGTIIAVAFLMPSDLNFISAIVSNFFLLTYALVNYATFNASYSKQPGWRPTFKYYNQWLSLGTGIACIVLMFFLDWKSAIITIALICVVFGVVYYRKPQTNWGTSIQANMFRTALSDALKLMKIEDHVKNYRPQILAVTGLPMVRPALVYFANSITHATGMLICGHVLINESAKERRMVTQETYKWLRRMRIKAFYESLNCSSFADGARALIQTAGLGKMKPNIILMGYHHSWGIAPGVTNEDYVDVIRTAFENHLGVMILYAKEGFGLSDAVDFDKVVKNNVIARVASVDELNETYSTVEEIPSDLKDTLTAQQKARVDLAKKFEIGKNKQIEGEIHVWWLWDDGGLSLLIPYLLTRYPPWNTCKLKIFCVTEKKGDEEVENARVNMKLLLEKFRIKADEITPVDLHSPPSEEHLRWFNNLIEDYRHGNVGQGRLASGPGLIGDFDLIDLKEKTLRHIKLRELLLTHSSKAALNVVTMPLPKPNRSATLYMATLETITAGMPTTLLIRGAHENVLTYYC